MQIMIKGCEKYEVGVGDIQSLEVRLAQNQKLNYCIHTYTGVKSMYAIVLVPKCIYVIYILTVKAQCIHSVCSKKGEVLPS